MVQGAIAGWRRHRRVALCLAAAVFLVGNAFAVRDLVVTRAESARVRNDAHQTEAQLDARRASLATLDAYRAGVLKTLGSETARRDFLLRQNSALRTALGEKTSAIVAAYAQIEHQHNHMVSLSECLIHVQAAMNTVSVGDLTNGATALDEVRMLCGATSQ